MGCYELRCARRELSLIIRAGLSCHADKGLLRTVYRTRKLKVENLPGMWNSWMASGRRAFLEQFFCVRARICYKSKGLREPTGGGLAVHRFQWLLARKERGAQDLQLQGAGSISDGTQAP